MDAKRIKDDIATIMARHDEYRALQERLANNYRAFVVMAGVSGLLIGMIVGASYWYLYGYPPGSATVEVLEVQKVEQVKVHSA